MGQAIRVTRSVLVKILENIGGDLNTSPYSPHEWPPAGAVADALARIDWGAVRAPVR